MTSEIMNIVYAHNAMIRELSKTSAYEDSEIFIKLTLEGTAICAAARKCSIMLCLDIPTGRIIFEGMRK